MNQEIYEELLFARTLITDTKGESIFHVLKDYFIEKAIPLSNIISVATDGAPAMTRCHEDDVSTYVQHLNALYSDFESRFEDILTMVIPPWIINPYGDIEETNVIIQEELTELSTNEELKVQFKNGYQQFWLNYPLKRVEKDSDGMNYGVAGEMNLIQNCTLTEQRITSFDWCVDKIGLAVCSSFDQSIRVLITTKLTSVLTAKT
ncbi:unnamed protein product [Acanthoscelides obtectus]|uniref:Uncharacterized protein n=1 Tax=Acanthoscelides obtectus TaxID=200917 RepID=A0A9P0NSX3_ACAOB|nr:unnamed protein product [Acanthoscelides obtectus]CAK1621192.1 WD repeat-containing protein 92 [Acanthoscelides obtectus]